MIDGAGKTKWARGFVGMALLAAGFGLGACSSLGIKGFGMPQTDRTRVASDKTFPPRPADYPIFLFEGDVEEAYQVIGTAQSKAYRENETQPLGEAELRESARQMGGDAVIFIARKPILTEEIGYRPGALTRSGSEWVTHYALGGKVVRFVR